MEKVNFTDQFALKLQLQPPHFSRSYAVKYCFRKGKQENTVKYNLEVSYVRTIINQARIFRLERSQEVFINDVLPDLLADQLAHECGKVFYPLMLEIDFDGKYIGLHNHAEIVARWKQQRPVIADYFKGELAEKYLILMDQVVSSQESVAGIFRSDLFCSVFFSSFYISYGPDLAIEKKMNFPIAGRAAAVEFMVSQKVNPVLNQAHNIEIEHQGKLTDRRTAADLLDEQSFPIEELTSAEVKALTGNYSGRYVLDAETRSLRSVFACWQLDFDQQEETELKVFEILHQEETLIREGTGEGKSGMVFIDESGTTKQKKVTDIFNFLWD